MLNWPTTYLRDNERVEIWESKWEIGQDFPTMRPCTELRIEGYVYDLISETYSLPAAGRQMLETLLLANGFRRRLTRLPKSE